MDENVKKDILAAITKEKELSIEENGYFHSDHEFLAILKDVIEELENDIHHLSVDRMSDLWYHVKINKPLTDRTWGFDMDYLKEITMNVIYETIQIAAEIDRYLEGEKKK